MFDCITEALEHVHELQKTNRHVEVLVTGSLHLVGGVLALEDPQGISQSGDA